MTKPTKHTGSDESSSVQPIVHARTRFLATAFVVVIAALGLINALLHTDNDVSELEFRTLQRAPELTLASYLDGSFARKADLFLTDQFFARGTSLKLRTVFNRLRGFGSFFATATGNPIYYVSDGNYCFRVYRNNPQAIFEYGVAVEALALAHPEYRVANLVVPSSAAFVPEELRSITDNPVDAIRALEEQYAARGLVKLVDPSPALAAHAVTDAFFRSDHHWNGDGVYAAYTAWCEAMGHEPASRDSLARYEIPGFLGSHYRVTQIEELAADPDAIVAYGSTIPVTLTRHTLSAASLTTLSAGDAPSRSAMPPHDLTSHLDPVHYVVDPKLMGAKPSYGIYLGGDYGLSVIEARHDSPKNAKLLVLKDSMGNALVPLLALHYDEVHIVDPRHWYASLTDYMYEQGIRDILILNSDTAALYGAYADYIHAFWGE